ncbi:hypothetical protein M407DRAFT_243609 [Tulasnella calospora MUT 4182]|uniref:Uncharacterized protein n=1 Tax=Tulasnella calospora MUT 4182 TaxID=1051891 RepID=A0A0C3QII8_9AGAM|nr:hypothetical protein M407DRAFT_243609 [Tulasnella calospora MUT 4182]
MGDGNRASDKNDATFAEGCILQSPAKRSVVLWRGGREYAGSLGTTKSTLELVSDKILA